MAYIKNLFIDQGADFSASISIKALPGFANYDITGCIIYAYIKKSDSSVNITAKFKYALVPELGQIILYLDYDETAIIPSGRYEYDVLIKDTLRNSTYRIVEGIVTVNPGVSIIDESVP
jgi:hypothetical protein